MVRVFFSILFLVSFFSVPASAVSFAAVRDSVGVEHKNGKVFVKHKVEPKETLYALSRKYGVSVAQIVEANPAVETTIKIGQIVFIPRNRTAAAAKPASPASKPAAVYTAAAPKTVPATTVASGAAAATSANSSGVTKLHVVEPKQTLYSISRMYQVSVEDIIRWNKMTSNQVNIGAELVVGIGTTASPAHTGYALASAADTATPKVIEPVAASGAATAKAEPVAVATPEPVEEEEEESGIRKVMESGLAEMIDPKADTDKYLALHRAAPVGTIMQVKNAMNGQVVYVRVIGKLPETGANDKVVVKISKKAYQKLGAVDSKFRVDLSYVP
ncbi:LysM peptidoglycan-binding domain-containing protein [Botryobacter ruber]|uniref:LysM peptidoglycan-binding domain-containing protein n=1 Tax=Botryobacter ruber TaxID=2171629 RepID=UPI001F0C51EB|nr:LysM domain-containing protein [Botryobacter ruber]